MINAYEDAPYFVDDVEFSGLDGNVLIKNAIFLDAFTQQPIKVFTQGIYAEAQWWMGRNKVTFAMPRAWTGSFQFRTGISEATYDVSGTPVTNEKIRIFHKNVLDTSWELVYEADWPSTQTRIDIDLTGYDYEDGDIIETIVEVYFPGPTYPKTGLYQVRDAFVSSVMDIPSLGEAPTLPVFDQLSISADALNKLASAEDWIMNRLSLIPRIPFVNAMYAYGTHKSSYPFPSNPFPIYIGWMKKNNNQNILHGVIDFYAYNGEEYVKIYVDDTLVYTSPKLYNGQYGTLKFDIDVSSFSDGQSYSVRIDNEVESGKGQAELKLYGESIINSRFTIQTLEVTNTRGYATPPTEFELLESMTYETWRSRLSSVRTMINNIYTRMSNAEPIFTRVPMFRRKVGVDDHQNSSLEWMSLPTNKRIGERYVVAGRDVKMCWNGHSLTDSFLNQPTERHPYAFSKEVELIGADKVDVREGYFEEFEGLEVGSTYFITGKDLSFFAEYLR
jgi:hypothetical protein